MPPSNKTGWRYVRCYRDRHGKPRWQFRRRGYQCEMPSPKHPDFEARYEAALARSKRGVVVESPAPIYSTEWTIARYQATEAWRGLAVGTRRTKGGLLARITKAWGHDDLATLTRADIMDRLDECPTPVTRNRVRGIYSQLCDLLVTLEVRPDNPVALIPRADEKTVNTPPWTEAEMRAFTRRHPSGSMARLAYELYRCTVQNGADVRLMGPSMIDRGHIVDHRQKTGARFEAPVTAELAHELKQHPKRVVWIVREDGAPYTPKGFSNRFAKWCEQAGVASRGHGLRVTGCIELVEGGATARELMAISAHVTLAEAERYVRLANQRKLARNANIKRLRANRDSGKGEP